jgi:hypothetical protein
MKLQCCIFCSVSNVYQLFLYVFSFKTPPKKDGVRSKGQWATDFKKLFYHERILSSLAVLNLHYILPKPTSCWQLPTGSIWSSELIFGNVLIFLFLWRKWNRLLSIKRYHIICQILRSVTVFCGEHEEFSAPDLHILSINVPTDVKLCFISKGKWGNVCLISFWQGELV